jgi:signal transduction histidine kinase
LNVIAARAESLGRFMQAYTRLAKLPPPQKEPVELTTLVRRAVELETRLPVRLVEGPEIVISADAAQIEQLLINILHNAVDASLDTGGKVVAGWRARGDCAEVFVRDEGPGIMNPSNLFVPFFTTKPGGSGIGLPLSRQIAEAHGGSLNLANRTDRTGSEALLRLPR